MELEFSSDRPTLHLRSCMVDEQISESEQSHGNTVYNHMISQGNPYLQEKSHILWWFGATICIKAWFILQHFPSVWHMVCRISWYGCPCYWHIRNLHASDCQVYKYTMSKPSFGGTTQEDLVSQYMLPWHMVKCVWPQCAYSIPFTSVQCTNLLEPSFSLFLFLG